MSSAANTPVVSLNSVHFSRSGRPILSDISWQVLPRQIAAILGPNGSGKSTLLRLASGYLWPQSGRIQLLGRTLGNVPLAPLRARIGIVEATTLYPFDEDLTAREVVLTGYFSALTLGFHRLSHGQTVHAGGLLEQVGLRGRAGQAYATLSTGERLRCLLARALVRKPELLLLDEPTAGLDLPAREAVLATLTRLHRSAHAPAIITVTHHLEELLPDTSNILLLSRQGTVVASGRPRSVLTGAHMSASFGIPIHVQHRNRRYTAHVDPATWSDLL